LNVDGAQPLPLQAEQALYRVSQEALANVARHSQATQVEISLVYTPETAQVTITDNGRGFDLNQKSTGIGLRSMRERMAMICGSLAIDTSPGQGTRVVIRADLSKSSEKSNNLTHGTQEGSTHA
jgi:signal transduction histidine kinase